MIKEIATLAPWFKATMKEKLGSLIAGEKVWVKLNTEKPLSLGPTYWIFQPATNKIMHIAEELGNEYLKRVYAGPGLGAIANEEQTKKLNARLYQKIVPIIRKWNSDAKQHSDLLQQHSQERVHKQGKTSRTT